MNLVDYRHSLRLSDQSQGVRVSLPFPITLSFLGAPRRTSSFSSIFSLSSPLTAPRAVAPRSCTLSSAVSVRTFPVDTVL